MELCVNSVLPYALISSDIKTTCLILRRSSLCHHISSDQARHGFHWALLWYAVVSGTTTLGADPLSKFWFRPSWIWLVCPALSPRKGEFRGQVKTCLHDVVKVNMINQTRPPSSLTPWSSSNASVPVFSGGHEVESEYSDYSLATPAHTQQNTPCSHTFSSEPAELLCAEVL